MAELLSKQKQAELAEYIADNYGTCRAEPRCICLRDGYWIGRGCKFWTPVKAKTWEELHASLGLRR